MIVELLMKGGENKNIMKRFLRNQKGFTLIELLIVIAVLGVLAAVVLVAIDPIEQLARGRDSGRKSSISQMGHALEAYATVNNSTYPPQATWMATLTGSGDIKIAPSAIGGGITGSPTCNTGVATNGFCYKTNNSQAVVYSNMESKAERNKGTCGGVQANTYFVYSSAAGKAGILCTEPTLGVTALLP